MRRFFMAAWVGLCLTYACSSSDPANSGSSAVVDPACVGDTAVPPASLACTGLYADFRSKTVGKDVQAYAPAFPLWSDGADKSRWIQLPDGGTIDGTDPSEWKFPVGTKAWKEFKIDGKRIETRLWFKKSATLWAAATYQWNADESAAKAFAGGDITLPSGGTYHIPTGAECTECHRGRTDRLLGFEMGLLGLDGATGYNLKALVDGQKIVPAPATTSLSIGDDGTGASAAAMGWLHTNCGVTCHNPNTNATAYGVGMDLRLDPTQLDGRSSKDFAARMTTLGIHAKTPAFADQQRIVPGDPDDSLIVHLISMRGDGQQMPPIATNKVDDEHVKIVRDWISKMGAPPSGDDDDAGVPVDSGVDSGVDAGAPTDAGSPSDSGAYDPDGAAGTKCIAGSIEEWESNDTTGTANVIPGKTETFCGRLGVGDTDYLTFTMPATTATYSFFQDSTDPKFAVNGTADGVPFTFSGGTIPFEPGKVYVLEMTATGAAAAVDYRITINLN